ncbi:MAG: PH domain-containing protein [Candidatus Nanopelagicales bacterium]
MNDGGGEVVVLRNPTTAAAGWIAMAVILLGTVLAVVWANDWSWPTDDQNVWLAVIAALAVQPILWLAFVRPRVIADDIGLAVAGRYFARTRRLPWADIESIDVEVGLNEGVVLTTADGEKIKPWALESGIGFGWSRPGHRWVTAVAAELDQMRVAHR